MRNADRKGLYGCSSNYDEELAAVVVVVVVVAA